MYYLKIILNSIAIPLALTATILIIFKNKHNLANILIGLTAFFGGVLSTVFSIIKEVVFKTNYDLAVVFAKLFYISIGLMSISILNFSIFFWRSKYKSIPRFLHFFAILPCLSIAIWLFADKDVISLNQITYGSVFIGVNNHVKLSFTVFSATLIILILVLLIVELSIMAVRAKNLPRLRRKMILFIIGLVIGLGGAAVSIVVFQTFNIEFLHPAPVFIILSSSILTFIFARTTLGKSQQKIWHGCPKLIIDKDGTMSCVNTEDGVPISVNLLDLGEIIERIQIDVDILKTGEGNCTNTVFNNGNTICCLTTHELIRVLDEIVTLEEMELAQEMEDLNGNELCSECLHKIIAYRKENKDKSTTEIKQFFLGIRVEEFFGLA